MQQIIDTEPSTNPKEVCMKRHIFVLAISVAAFILGCEEDTLIDPATQPGTGLLDKVAPVPVVQPTIILIDMILPDPRPGFNNIDAVSGNVSYLLTTASSVSSNLGVTKRLDLSLKILVTPFWGGGPVGKVSLTSSDMVTLPSNGASTLQKEYPVSGDAGLVLNMDFKVTGSSVTVSRMWLSTTSSTIHQTEALAKAACQGFIAMDEEIPFAVIELNPLINQSIYVAGTVGYQMGQPPVLVRDQVTVSLSLNADLRPVNGTDPIWSFSAESEDVVALSNSGPTLLLKKYGGRSQLSFVTLYVQYEVSKCKVTVESMWAVSRPIPSPVPVTP